MIVCLLETYFADEIDSFPKEKGFFSSPKPVIADIGMSVPELVDFLEIFLQIETAISVDANESMISTNDSVNIVSKKIKNGCDFCIIVRDE